MISMQTFFNMRKSLGVTSRLLKSIEFYLGSKRRWKRRAFVKAVVLKC